MPLLPTGLATGVAVMRIGQPNELLFRCLRLQNNFRFIGGVLVRVGGVFVLAHDCSPIVNIGADVDRLPVS